MKVKHEFKPIYDNKSKILILGTMPSIKSRANKFYYSNPTNRFFKIMETLFNTKLLNNDDKKAFLIKNKIALWDVCKECDILASSDSSIKNIIPNDINILINAKAIFFIIFIDISPFFYIFLPNLVSFSSINLSFMFKTS